jgi:hypothetical protein
MRGLTTAPVAPHDGSPQPTWLAEYAAAQASYLHYDAFRWQAGSFLIAGVFIFWGLLLQQPTPGDVAGIASLLVTGLMSTWLLFAHHYRQIYLCKLHRLDELEDQLGMKQHLRFKTREYDARGPRGHVLDVVVYLLIIAGTPALGIARKRVLVVVLPTTAARYHHGKRRHPERTARSKDAHVGDATLRSKPRAQDELALPRVVGAVVAGVSREFRIRGAS